MRKKLKSLLRKLGFHLESGQKTAPDIVCGMEIHIQETRFASVYNSEAYYFCSASCKKHFEDNPKNYTG